MILTAFETWVLILGTACIVMALVMFARRPIAPRCFSCELTHHGVCDGTRYGSFPSSCGCHCRRRSPARW